MRKIKLCCSQAATFYATASCAITHAGLDRGFKEKPSVSHTVRLEDGERLRPESHYEIGFDPETEAVACIISTRGCKAQFDFTWPDLKLYSIQVQTCSCSRWRVI